MPEKVVRIGRAFFSQASFWQRGREAPNFTSPGKEKIVTTNAASPARNEGAPQNRQLQGEAAAPGENWRQQIEEMLQPTIASLRQQVAQAAEQQLEPLRSRIQRLAEQQQNGKAQQQANASPSQSLAPAAETPAPQVSARESALQQWGETLEGTALIILALGETLEGLALLMQALGIVVGGKPSSQQEEPSPQEEKAQEAEEAEPSAPEEREEPSLVQKVGDTVSGGAASVKQAVGHAAESSAPALHGLERALASLPQWARILEHASALVQALGDSASSQQDGMQKWGPILKHGAPLVKELSQALGGSSFQQGGHGGNAQRWGRMIGRAASALEALGNGSSQKQEDAKSSAQEREGASSSNQEQEKGSSVKEKLGGVTSTLKDLAGGSSSEKKKDGEGSSPLDALTGEGSPLQMLREFSKRQQGPGGLAPKGPVGRKPPPGPLRRDRIPKEE